MCPFKEDNNHENTEELMILCFSHSFAAFWCFIALTNYDIWLSRETFLTCGDTTKVPDDMIIWQHISLT